MLKTGVIRLREIEGQNVCQIRQIAFCTFHSFQVLFQTKLAIYVPCIRNFNREIMIAGCSCCPEKIMINFSLQCCVLNFHQFSDLSEIVHVVKAVIIALVYT